MSSESIFDKFSRDCEHDNARRWRAQGRACTLAALEDSIIERQRHGPIAEVGDWNTSRRYRRAGECAIFGPNLFSPLTRGVDTVNRVRDGTMPLIADHADPASPSPCRARAAMYSPNSLPCPHRRSAQARNRTLATKLCFS